MMRFLSSICFSALLLACTESSTTVSVPSTAAANVQELPFEFVVDGLDRQRKVRLYLPTDYQTSEQSYPVIYMLDGQNLFDDATAYAGEWGVDETLNQMATTEGLKFIVVGIDNGGDKRMNEYSPWVNKRFGAAQGALFTTFIVDVVKPFIDNNYRTLDDVEHTAIIGSSMGGLLAHYALHAHPQIFGKAGIFSPSYWYSADVFTYSKDHKASLDAKIYVMYGDKEGDGMIVDTTYMQQQLRKQGHPRQNMLFKRVLGGEHNEALWRSQFADAVRWLFSS
ncbi:alpha/beta hydrolase [Flavobacterium sp. W21_SRS_FM6]|uniref:alpha/beta hydrolase n=1 Tax=Flavobacterium sp. W21_SRS_FM6 TaxID=3240268 RepID=UPI003F93B26F